MKLLLLFVPCVVALWVPLYNVEAPALFGMPFFYWFQLSVDPGFRASRSSPPTGSGGATPMFDHLNVVAASVFVFFFALVTVLGFVAARWKAADLDHILEWGLGGRRFGPWITWFLLGGDLYTAYTVIAVPAVVYAIGAFGFFAVPYTIIIYPFLYLTLPRLWAVSHKHGYMTAGDFVLGRYGDRWLELAVALTGILATMPYIALQLVGLEKVIGALGFSGEGLMQHAPITIAFVILALYTYKSGLRAPAMIAFVKDAMIYVFVIAAVVVVPYRARRLRQDLRGRAGRLRRQGRRQGGPRRGPHARARTGRPLHHARDRLGDGALHVSARADRRSRPPRAAARSGRTR